MLIAGGGALAAQQAPTYPTAYWISGAITAGNTGLTDLSGFTVTFYKNSGNPTSAFAAAITDSGGNFLLNAHDDLDLLPLESGDYYLGVTSKVVEGKNYGVNETKITFASTDITNGYKVGSTLALVENQGLPTTANTGSASGNILDPATGKPAAGTDATIWVDGTKYTAVTADSNGNFTVDNLTPGSHIITVGTLGGTKSIEITITAGTTNALGNLTPVPGGAILGTLKDSAGKVLGTKEVTIAMDGKTYTAATDAQGHFALDGIPVGKYSTIILTSEGLTKTLTNKEVINGQGLSLSAILSPLPGTGSVSGTVTDPNGKYLSGVLVTTDGIIYTLTNTSGAYSLFSLLPGSVTAHASAAGFAPNSAAAQVKEGQNTKADNIVLTPLSAGKSVIKGFVKDGSTPLLAAKVDAGSQSTLSGSDGWYQLVIDKGNIILKVSLSGYKSTSETVVLKENEVKQVNFNLAPLSETNNGTIIGVVTDQKARVGVSATVSDGTRIVDTDSNGNYSINNVPAGNYTVRASANGYVPNEKDITVTAGQTIKVNLPLSALPQKKAVIHGNVLDNNGAKLSAFKVEAKGDTESPSIFGIDGTYQLTLAPGSYVVTVSLSGYKSATQNLTIAAGDTRQVDFILEKITALEPNPKVEIWFGNRLYQKALAEKGEKFVTASKPEIKINVSVDDPYTLPQDLGEYKITLDPGSAAAKTYNLTAKNITQKVLSTQKVVAAGITTTEKIRAFTLQYTITDEIPDGSHVIAVTAKTSGIFGIAGVQTESASIEVMGGPLRVAGPTLTYPSPFSITKQKVVTIQYTLSVNSDIDIYLTGVSGMRIKKFSFSSGTEGGTAGTNKVTWDGVTDQGFLAGNAIYVGTIISRTDSKLLDKFKLTIVD